MKMGAPVAVVALLALIALVLSLLYSILSSLRKRIPARVNCWFCNTNSWVHYRLHNSWTCKKCEQYNGFLPDGSYNVVLDTRTANPINFNKNLKHPSSANNGFCRKCNVNQQLKIRQLSSFVPMNEKNFDAEVDSFKKHLEKVYSLCSICKKYLKQKLSSEKGLLLGTKLLDNRIKHEIVKKMSIKSSTVSFTKIILKKLPMLLIIFSLYSVFLHLELFLSKKILNVTKKYVDSVSSDAKNLSSPYLNSAMNIIFQYSDEFKVTPLFKQYSFLLTTFDSYSDFYRINELKTLFRTVDDFSCIDIITLMGFFLNFLIHVYEFNFNPKKIICDIIWGIGFYISRTGIEYFYALQVFIGIVLFILSDTSDVKRLKTSKNIKNKLKNLSSNKLSDISSEDDLFSDKSNSDSSDSEDSLAGSNYFDKPNFKLSPNSIDSFNYRKENVISPFHSSSQYNSFAPFNKDFLNFSNISNKNDSELDKSISSLSIGKLNKTSKTDPFSTRQYNCTSPSIFMPSPQFSKPILSPSRLAHRTQQSWVAGGYWGTDNSLLYNMHETGSSSSQSSGFESLTSSMYRRNANSFPPSRGESVSSECDRRTEDFNRALNLSSFMPQKSPIFPNVNGKESVFIPSVPFDSNYNMLDNSAFARRNPDKSFVPLQGPFSESSYRFSS